MTLDEFEVPEKERQVSVYFRFETENISGQTSATDRVNKGIKPKSLSVSLQIDMNEAHLLTELVAISETIDDKGGMKVFDLVEPLAKALKIRQVKFTDNFNVSEIEHKRAWRVYFVLTEHLSTSEKNLLRQDEPIIEEQQADGELVGPVASTTQDEPAVELTGFESVLQFFEDKLR